MEVPLNIANLLIAFLVAVPATITSIATLIFVLRQNKKVDALHKEVNGRLTELINVTGMQQRQEGREQGRQDEITDRKNRENQ